MKKKQSRPARADSAKTSSARAANSPPPAAAKPNAAVPSFTSTFSFKGVILFFISILMVFIFFGFERNKALLNDRIIAYWNDYQEQKDKPDIEERKVNRYGYDYLFPKSIAEFFQKKGNTDKILLLMPSTDYLKQHGMDIHVVEPSIFYYFTGLKTVWAHNPKAVNANWVLTVDKGQLVFDSVTSKDMLIHMIDSFKKYKYDL